MIHPFVGSVSHVHFGSVRVGGDVAQSTIPVSLAVAGHPVHEGDLGFEEVVDLVQVQTLVAAAVVPRFGVTISTWLAVADCAPRSSQ